VRWIAIDLRQNPNLTVNAVKEIVQFVSRLENLTVFEIKCNFVDKGNINILDFIKFV